MIAPARPPRTAIRPPFTPSRALSIGLGLLAGWLASLETSSAQHLRIVAANLTSENQQTYDGGHGARILQGLRPDLCLIQEFNYGSNSPAAVRTFVDTTFGTEFSYYREAGAQIPNGIISRHPIVASGEWDDPAVSNRDFAWARIDVPGPTDLWAVSVHFLTSGSTVRDTEARALREFINTHVPAGDFLVIGGDFNTDVRSEPCLGTLSAVVHIGAPHPADQNGNQNTNNPPSGVRAKPYDGIYVNAALRALQSQVVTGETAFAHTASTSGAVIDTRVYAAKGRISDIEPAFATDSAAAQMQHMAVVKDFTLPVPPDPPILPLEHATFALGPPATLALRFGSTPGADYTVEATPDLGGPHWVALGSVAATANLTEVRVVSGPAGTGEVSDPELLATARRFYRVRRR